MDVTKKQLNVLIQLAEADKHFASLERDMIQRIANDKNISREEVRQLIKFPEPIDLDNLNREQRFEHLCNSIELVFADRKIFDVEIMFCKKIAAKLGFNTDLVDHFIEHFGKDDYEDLKRLAFERFAP